MKKDHTHVPVVLLAVFCCVVMTLVSVGCKDSPPQEPPAPAPDEPVVPVAPNEPAGVEDSPKPADVLAAPGDEISLFDGKSLGLWNVTDFGGQGEVTVKDGAIHMAMGNDMTGITWSGPVIRTNYELTLEATRTMGSDFFCGLTFPVGERPCSLILGGWGGEVCGLSNIDYYDAANNETTRIISFEKNKWVRVRLRVTPQKIQAWLDGEDLVDIGIEGRHVDIRPEVDLSKPLGIATWQTAGAVRNIKLKPLPEVE